MGPSRKICSTSNSPKSVRFLTFLIFVVLSLFSSCPSPSTPSGSSNLGGNPFRLIVNQPPVTLNPRLALDPTGQRLGALLFRGLTHLNAELEPKSDLAKSWYFDAKKLFWIFEINQNLNDHLGEKISTQDVVKCLEQYRDGKPHSPLRQSFPNWVSTSGANNQITIQLSKPDPYFPRNASLLRFFRNLNSPVPCSEPVSGVPLIGSGDYLPINESNNDLLTNLTPKEEFLLRKKYSDTKIQFIFIKDENTRTLKLLKGDADGIQNGLSISKTHWFKSKQSHKFKVLERKGVNLTYLAFNLKHPILSKLLVRKAIAHAIQRDDIVKYKHFGFSYKGGSFLAPLLNEGSEIDYAYDPQKSEALLEEAGYPKNKDGIRVKLHYKTTSSLIGMERGMLLQRNLRDVGIELIMDVVESAVFFSSVNKGNYEIYSSRWIGVADGSIYYITLFTGQKRNRVGYSNLAMDRLLEKAVSEMNPKTRKALIGEIEKKMLNDLPYLPLWFWKNALVVRKNWKGLDEHDLSLSGAFEPIGNLKHETSDL